MVIKKKIETAKLFELCNKEMLFTCGSREQYEKMFELASNGITQEELAYILYVCSSYRLNVINNMIAPLFLTQEGCKIEIEKGEEDQSFYFTFGSAETQPFCFGYVKTAAKNKEEAKAKFNKKYGFNKDGEGRYSSCYDEKLFLKLFPNEEKNGGPQHEEIM